MPSIIFTLYAGPLSDRYGRKPLILVSFVGYFFLNLVFLINSYWFYDLKVTNIYASVLLIASKNIYIIKSSYKKGSIHLNNSETHPSNVVVELQVEYLLLECLQDVTGGEAVFWLATYALMADLTTQENRTKRMAVLDAFKYVGMAIGLFLGGIIKSKFGWTPLYLTSLTLILINILYVIVFVKEGSMKEKNRKTENERHVTCCGGFCIIY